MSLLCDETIRLYSIAFDCDKICVIINCCQCTLHSIIRLFHPVRIHKNRELAGCKNMIFLVQPASFFRPEMFQNCWRPGLRPGPRWESSLRSPRPPSQLGRGKAPPIFHPLGASCASILAPSAFHGRCPPTENAFRRLCLTDHKDVDLEISPSSHTNRIIEVSIGL